jgi:hypothetical protein
VLGLDRPTKTLYDLTRVAGRGRRREAPRLRAQARERLHILPAPLRPEVGESIDAAGSPAVLQTARSMYDAIVVDTRRSSTARC